jgi:thymidylate synthase
LESRKVKKTKKINLEIVMKNNIEHQYLKLLKDILDNGVTKQDRTGTGTLSVFGRQIRHDMKLGFPLLTTKKMFWKGIVTELLWFLRGDTNIKYLVDNDCHIWDGDAYQAYLKNWKPQPVVENELHWLEQELVSDRPLPKDMFIHCIKTDDEFAKKWGELGPVYGKQWREWNRYKWDKIDFDTRIEYVDQIENLINDLKTNPDSRRLMVSAWNVSELDQMTLPPCHYGFQVYTRELSLEERRKLAKYDSEFVSPMMVESWDRNNIPTRAISLMWNQRSVDTFLGLPFNIASYGLLLEIIAKAVNMVPDELIGNLGDTHLYSNHIKQAKEQLTREPYPLPTLNINTEWWPTESGECGVGPIDAAAVVEGLSNDNFCKCLLEEDLATINHTQQLKHRYQIKK